MTVVIRNKKQLARAKEKLDILEKAWEKAVNAKSYSIGSDALERQKLEDLEEEIQAYENAIDDYETRGTSKRRSVRIVPI